MQKIRRSEIIILTLFSCFATLSCEKNYLQEHIKDEAPETYGSWEIGHTTFTAVDTAKDKRKIKMDAWFPVDEALVGKDLLSSYKLKGPLALTADIAVKNRPVSNTDKRKLLVFSHGYKGTNTQSTPLMETLASHGFIVVAPEHTGNCQSSPGDSFDQAAMNRVPDISFTIDTMFLRNKDAGDIFYDRIDESEVGVVGHSFGGMTTIGTAAGWAEAKADPRVKAIAPISAVIQSSLTDKNRPGPYASLDQQALSKIDIPVMLIGGTKDIHVYIENNEVAFNWIKDPEVYRVDIIGANHTHFANVCAIGNFLLDYKISQGLWGVIGAEELKEPYNATCSEEAFPIDKAERLQNLYVVAFFKYYLYRLNNYKYYLTEEYASENEKDVIFYKK